MSSAAPLSEPDERVRVSPSDLVTVADCPLQWLLGRAGGRDGRSEQRLAADLGMLLHALAEEFPRGGLEPMLRRFEERWPSLGLGDGWDGRRQHARAEEMVQRLAGYVESIPGEVETEQSFDVEIGRADLVGRVDRVEHLDEGAVRIVDLKSSSSPVSRTEAEQHPQLAAYQAAVLAGALPGCVPGGARLVYLGTGRSAALRDQPAVAQGDGEDSWATRLVLDSAEVMAGARFAARTGKACRHCALQRCCPAQDAGERVVGR